MQRYYCYTGTYDESAYHPKRETGLRSIFTRRALYPLKIKKRHYYESTS